LFQVWTAKQRSLCQPCSMTDDQEPLVGESNRPIIIPPSGFPRTPQPDRMEYANPFNLLGCGRSVDPVDPEVRSLADEHKDKLTFHAVSGPAVRRMRFALPLKFVSILFFPVVAWMASSCPAAASTALFGLYHGGFGLSMCLAFSSHVDGSGRASS